LLPGGANPVPGRDFHPQSTSAFPRRTCYRDFSPIASRFACSRVANIHSFDPLQSDAKRNIRNSKAVLRIFSQ
jgi:hypothetical protein